jgi:serine/threonine protein kinase
LALIGKELRGIKLLSKAGAGGMGTVYQGRVQKSRRGLTAGMDVAVKVLHPHLADDPASLSRFKLEAGLGLSLKHPNIVRILHVGSERIEGAQVHFLVQEYVQGVTLEALVNEQDPLSDSFLRKIALQIAEALSEIHGREIVHRDLKPANVFLERDGTVKLADFGFSHVARGLRKSDSSSLFLGTVAYAAPERFGPYRATQSSDLYSFGVILYELAVGRNPFLGEGLNETLAHHADLVPTEPVLLNPSITPFMNLFIMKLLEKAPSARLGPSTRLTGILKEGQGSQWWKRNQPESQAGPISDRRRRLQVARKTPVYGRREETRLLLRLMEEVEETGTCRTVFLFGEAGSGKTRLMDRFLEELDRGEKPGRVFVLEGMQTRVKVPFFPIISAFRNAFDMGGLERDELREALIDKLTRICPDRAQEIERFSHFLISTVQDPDANPDILPPESIVRLFTEIFQTLAEEEPVILIVENVREADPPTFRVITSLLSQIRDTRILVLLTARPGETNQAEPEKGHDLQGFSHILEEEHDTRILQVKRLGRAGVNRIISELGFHEKMVNGPLGELIFGTTEGNP